MLVGSGIAYEKRDGSGKRPVVLFLKTHYWSFVLDETRPDFIVHSPAPILQTLPTSVVVLLPQTTTPCTSILLMKEKEKGVGVETEVVLREEVRWILHEVINGCLKIRTFLWFLSRQDHERVILLRYDE